MAVSGKRISSMCIFACLTCARFLPDYSSWAVVVKFVDFGFLRGWIVLVAVSPPSHFFDTLSKPPQDVILGGKKKSCLSLSMPVSSPFVSDNYSYTLFPR